ncbi:ACT-like superfamily protein [Carex rostrata]
MEACCPYFDPDFENFNQRIYGPRVTVDNESCENCTVIKVNSLTEQDLLLEVLQVLTDMDLCITKSYISSDAGWFMDVFHVKDQNSNKVQDKSAISYIQQAIGAGWIHHDSEPRKQKEATLFPKYEENSSSDCTEIEMIGPNRPGIFSEISAVLAEQRCNIVEAHAWTHNDCLACVAKISSDEPTSPQIHDPSRLATIKDHLSTVLHSGGVKARFLGCNSTVGQADAERRLHQLMFARLDFDHHYYSEIDVGKYDLVEGRRTVVSVDGCNEKRYSVVNVECLDRPRLMFDTVCTLADLHYVVFHASIVSHGPFASQEYYIRHKNGRVLDSADEKQLIVKCLEAAIERRICEGVRLELCTENNLGLLSYITRVLRENGLTVAHADIETKGENATNVLYVQDISGNSNIDQTVLETIRKQLDPLAFQVKHYEVSSLSSSPRRKSSMSPERDAISFVSLLRSKIERFSHGFISM